jgi:hypothetical protein
MTVFRARTPNSPDEYIYLFIYLFIYVVYQRVYTLLQII